MANEDRMQTVAGALEQFRDRGYRLEMAIKAGRLQVDGTDRTYRPDQVVVCDYWRYEGVSDPDDESVVYAIETSDGTKGTLVDAYNAYADPSVGEFLRAVTTTSRPVKDPEPTLPPFEKVADPGDARRG
ncbi:MAG TPA: hypothetical protein VIA61_07845 [Methylomirabilota bacterium]|jgi:hypothetical protein